MKGAPMHVATRYGLLLRGLESDGRVDVSDFAGRLGVTQETIRRDLRALEVDGKLRRVYGGAIPLDDSPALTLFPTSSTVSADDLEFGRQVWEKLPRSGTLALGAGPWAAAVARAAVHDPPDPPGLTIVTTSLDAATDLSRGDSSLAVYLVGGTVCPATGGQEGQWAIEELRRFQVDVCVVHASGVHVSAGLGSETTATAAVNSAVVDTARSVIALVAAADVGRPAFVRFSDLDRADLIVVKGRLADPVAQQFADRPVCEV